MNKTFEQILLWGGLVATMTGMYVSLDKAAQMTQVNPTNNVVFHFKTVENSQTTNENYSVRNKSYKN